MLTEEVLEINPKYWIAFFPRIRRMFSKRHVPYKLVKYQKVQFKILRLRVRQKNISFYPVFQVIFALTKSTHTFTAVICYYQRELLLKLEILKNWNMLNNFSH